MLRNPTTNCGEVEATPVPVVLNFSESFLGSGQGNLNGPRDFNVGNIRDQQRERGCLDCTGRVNMPAQRGNAASAIWPQQHTRRRPPRGNRIQSTTTRSSGTNTQALERQQ
jgi:hypothetical protein